MRLEMHVLNIWYCCMRVRKPIFRTGSKEEGQKEL